MAEDDHDALRGESLRSVLRQLCDGYHSRPHAFPHSVTLYGLRDVRDYKAASGGDPNRLGTPSPFNIKSDSLRIGDFTEDDVRELYGQYSAETGQPFSSDALVRAWEYTKGQPWLVNALAREITMRMRIDPPAPITLEHVDQARERLIQARATHLDSLSANLHEPRVRRVVAPLIAGELALGDSTYNDDIAYLRDLGLITQTPPIAIANPIYREVVVRVLGANTEDNVTADPRSFILPDGRLDFEKLLREFAAFWRQHGEILVEGTGYHEAAPQLVMMAYLHRVINGGGYIDREYGAGRGRIDLVVRWPYADADGKRTVQYEGVELKVWRDRSVDPLDEGLEQLDAYLDRLGLDHGTLIIFDRRSTAPPLTERISFSAARTAAGRAVTLLRA
ncbi:ATP-binding protein [Phytoactinopolyspora halotolerans]|uniref:ATP-binding protein n=1 Tax=Phytoactinopolyspora halotolerans TaxID=1981512 RepID=A0A6L9SDE1_9ACTN|nr:ATP-binding protein [Phytoactinopolyspora halotolerans]NEE03276.1 ATP-binding protein [Phytoactinopolyspora halotolerans]